MIDNLALLRAFVAVVEMGSFSQAGQRLRVVPSTISKHIAALENDLGGQLVIRSTQRLSITELGRQFYQQALAVLREVDEAERLVSEYKAEPQGVLRIAAATVFSLHHLTPVLTSFLDDHPHLKVEVSLSTATENLIADGFDVAIRVSGDLDPGLIALKLAPNIGVYCAAPAYLAEHGTPYSAADLEGHNCLLVRGIPQDARWPIRNGDGVVEQITVAGNLISNNGDLRRQLLLAGVGIARMSLFMVHEHLAAGELIELFPESRAVTGHIYAVYPERRNLPLKTRAFLDHLKRCFHRSLPWT